jgi:predicted phage-related endonuclease
MDPNSPHAVEVCLRLIGRLPQAAVIQPEHALRWVERTLKIDPERIEWHIARAGGIGGSEAGGILSWAGEGFNARESAHRLGLRKLLRLAPDAPNFDTGRGHKLEPYIRSIYEERLTRDGHQWRRRDDLRSKVEGGTHPDFPCMRASLDGLYEIDGAIVIPDFKAPSEDSLTSYMQHGDYHDYRAQLNHYAFVAAGRGVHIDALQLAFFDYRRVSTEGVRICPIEVDPDLQQRMAQAATAFWQDHVMQGIAPADDRERVLAHPDVPQEVEEAAVRAVNAKMLADRFEETYETERGKVARWVHVTGRLGDGMLPLGSFSPGARGLLEVRSKPVLDLDAAVARLRQLGMGDNAIEDLRLPPNDGDKDKLRAAYSKALSALRSVATAIQTSTVDEGTLLDIRAALAAVPGKEKSGFDPVRVTEALVSFGEVPYHFSTERVAGTLPRGKAQDVLERKDLVAVLGDELLVSLVPCMQEAEELNDELPAGPTPGR